MLHPLAATKTLYIYNDLPYYRNGHRSFTWLLYTLEEALRENESVILVNVDEQIEVLAQGSAHAPFDLALGAGPAGCRVACALHEKTGWFPNKRMISVARQEVGRGQYKIISPNGRPLASQIAATQCSSLAIVDDTVYSGLTLTSLLCLLPLSVRRVTEVFCLQAISESIARTRMLCPVYAGMEIPGKKEVDVSVIKASSLFIKGAIRRASKSDLAFFQRPEWICAWFPRNADTVIYLCKQLWELEKAVFHRQAV